MTIWPVACRNPVRKRGALALVPSWIDDRQVGRRRSAISLRMSRVPSVEQSSTRMICFRTPGRGPGGGSRGSCSARCRRGSRPRGPGLRGSGRSPAAGRPIRRGAGSATPGARRRSRGGRRHSCRGAGSSWFGCDDPSRRGPRSKPPFDQGVRTAIIKRFGPGRKHDRADLRGPRGAGWLRKQRGPPGRRDAPAGRETPGGLSFSMRDRPCQTPGAAGGAGAAGGVVGAGAGGAEAAAAGPALRYALIAVLVGLISQAIAAAARLSLMTAWPSAADRIMPRTLPGMLDLGNGIGLPVICRRSHERSISYS